MSEQGTRVPRSAALVRPGTNHVAVVVGTRDRAHPTKMVDILQNCRVGKASSCPPKPATNLRLAVLVVCSILLFAGSPAAGSGPAALSAATGFVEAGAGELTRLAPAPALSLPDCVRLALEHNPSLDVAGKEQSIQALERPRAFSSHTDCTRPL